MTWRVFRAIQASPEPAGPFSCSGCLSLRQCLRNRAARTVQYEPLRPPMSLPAIFVSHGAPNLILHDAPVRDFLATYGKSLPKPKAIVIVSAHFGTREAAVVVDQKPGMIYDFGGFEPELYTMQYPAPGAPELAVRVGELLQAAGIPVHGVQNRGYDHGTWVPLKLLYPDADIPVLQLSVQPKADP
eukprot:gene25038-27043_t